MYNQNMYYQNLYPYQNMGMARSGTSRITSLFRGHHINWTNVLNNTQKTLNVINQAIPVYYQIKPIYNNARTMLRMVSALNSSDSDNNSTNVSQN